MPRDGVESWLGLFEVEYLQSENLVSTMALGRGATFFFSWESQRFVLKHFYRGGLVRFLLKDWYFWTGEGKSRPEKEFVLWGKMAEMGLPITRPVAARIRKMGLFYQADVITEELMGVRPLSRILQERALSEEEWRGVGQWVRRFHDRSVCHTDLNAHNVMMSGEEMYLIDFDNGSIREGEEWKLANVERWNGLY